MSIRSELRTLIRLVPHLTATLITDANLNLLLDKAQIAIGLDGRALPKNEQVNTVASQAEYVVSGASPVLTDNDFLGIDLVGGGVLFYDGTNWRGPQENFVPKTREWLDKNRPGWRTASSAATPLYWYCDQGVETTNLVVGLYNKPTSATTDGLWIHYLSRGVLMSADTHYPFTGSITQLRYLEPYDILFVYWCVEYINRFILSNHDQANLFKQLYEIGAQAMANRLPLEEHLLREPMLPDTNRFAGAWGLGGIGGRRRGIDWVTRRSSIGCLRGSLEATR